MGSWSTSASCNPALVYSLRRFEASTVYLPAPCSRGALERADYVGGDPTAVEIPFLRLDLLPPDPAPVHPGRVEGHVVFYACERRRRVGVEPRRPRLRPLFRGCVVVTRPPLPLAVRASARGLQMLHPYVLRRDVVHGRVARLEDAFRPCGIGERYATEDDLDLLAYVLELRRTRVVPDGLLSGAGLYSLTAHENLLVSDRLRLYGRKMLPCIRSYSTSDGP